MCNYYLFSVSKTNACIDVHDKLKNEGINCFIVTAPSFFEQGCGLAIKIMPEDYENAKAVLFNTTFVNTLIVYSVYINEKNEYTHIKINLSSTERREK